MPGKINSFIKVLSKIVLWATASTAALLFCVAFSLRIPFIQKKLGVETGKILSKKTGAEINVKRLAILLPGKIQIEGLFVKDLQKDTLLYADKIELGFDLPALLKKHLYLTLISLKSTTAKINRSDKDTLFNFSFLINAFSAKSPETAPSEVTGKKWVLSIGKIALNNVRFIYNDKHTGTYSATDLKLLELSFNEFDLEKNVFRADRLLINTIKERVRLNKTTAPQTVETYTQLPLISANRVDLKNADIIYSDQPSGFLIKALASHFFFTGVNINLNSNKLEFGQIFSYKNTISIDDPSIQIAHDSVGTASPNWIVSGKKINISENNFTYVHTNTIQPGHFNPDNFKFQHIFLKAENCYYSTDSINAKIERLALEDNNNFKLHEFSVNFSLASRNISAEDVKLKTNLSDIQTSIDLRYRSLQLLKDSIASTSFIAELKKSKINPAEILYFFPQLKETYFFKNNAGSITGSGLAKGTLKKFTGKIISIQTLNTTCIATDFFIEGLPDFKNAYYSFPDLNIETGAHDLKTIFGEEALPKKIGIPSRIHLQLNFEGTLKSFKTIASLKSDFGNFILNGGIDRAENFKGNLKLSGFNAGKLLKKEGLFGPVSLVLDAKGQGIDPKTINASVKANISEFYFNYYSCKGLTIYAGIKGQRYEGEIDLKDNNAEFHLNGLVNLEPDSEQLKLNLNVAAADLKRLNLTQQDFKIAFSAASDLKGKNIQTVNGNAGITNIFIVHGNDKYSFDSVLFAAINEKGRSELNVKSAIVGIKYNGAFAPSDLIKELRKNINTYFPFEKANMTQPEKTEPQNFNFEVTIHNHPILSEVLFPKLKEFESGIFKGSYDGEKKKLSLDIPVKKLSYGDITLNNLLVTVNSNNDELNYRLSAENVSNMRFKLDNAVIDGKLRDNKAAMSISSIDKNNFKRLMLQTEIFPENQNFKIKINPGEFFLMNDPWNAAADGYILIGPKNLMIHNMELAKSQSKISITSVNDEANGDIRAVIKNFELGDISRIFEKDTALARGTVNADLLLKKINKRYGLVSSLTISGLTVKNILIGDVGLRAENPEPDNFKLDLNINGAGNNIRTKGSYSPEKEADALNLNLAITSLSLPAIEAFSGGRISQTSGNISGTINLTGSFKEPLLNGSLNFENVFVKPAFLNNRIQLKNESVKVSDNEIFLNSFTVLDRTNHPATIDGTIKMKPFSDPVMELDIKTNEFLLLNTTAKINPEYYGRLIIDSKLKIKGPASSPVINSSIKLKKGSHFTFAVPGSELTADRGENIVQFEDSLKLNPILSRKEKKEEQKTGVSNFNISSTIEIDNKAILKILPDPGSKDSLVVKGEAALAFVSDAGGKKTLTGTYQLREGSYLVSLENIVKKQFKIENGSTITWSGEPLDPDININAVYSIRTSPIDLIADQSLESYRGSFGQSYQFLVYLKIRGALQHPEISFEIQLARNEKGTLGNIINAKLTQLNENPSALNKQVFALLALNRFIQENPFQTETEATSAVARTTVSKFLSDQLNQLSSKFIPGVNLNFNVQSYNEYSSGQAAGRTQVEVGLSKQLFNERLNVQVGGSVDVEGEKTKQNSATDVAGDVNVEYKVTKDGRYRLKGFRHNQYEGVIEGQITETGTGLLYVYDFNKWLEIFQKEKKKTPQKDSSSIDHIKK